MGHLLTSLLFILFLIILFGIINEKTIKISNDIALVLFSFLLAALLKVIDLTNLFPIEDSVIGTITGIDIQEFLMEGVLCFMLFAGASGVNFRRFVKNLKSISLLALLSTVMSSFVYGGLFWLLSVLLKLDVSILACVLLGCIVSPTDPIAATSILKKAGLSKNVSTVIEGESLFNDGTGVALFICIRNVIKHTSEMGFFALMAKELLGAIAIGLAISFVMYKLLKCTNNPMLHIFISLLDVTAAYVICEEVGCSGVIASVVCGIYFSRMRVNDEAWFRVVDTEEWYEKFWHMADTLFNSVLFILIGFYAMNIPMHRFLVVLILAAIVLNFAARFIGVGISTMIIGKHKIPNRYSLKEFSVLMTWSALKGGLSLALAFGTREFLPESIYKVFLIMTCVTMYFTIVVQGLTTKKIFAYVESLKKKRISGM